MRVSILSFRINSFRRTEPKRHKKEIRSRKNQRTTTKRETKRKKCNPGYPEINETKKSGKLKNDDRQIKADASIGMGKAKRA